ncbi:MULTISPECIES: hypothetical protein [unclassified Streptomyces]|uniref:hypothetical protein n=1 Tax=unclassified Streptomyces TaxID=2593676 RepID=UPI00081F16B9|nr:MULTISPECIES: hypothetical protein [unclassified Streptomyces]MYZ38683.1 hypothetical protein [Streptomyces sp. SID4917]SCF99820.1 hypothetical protein GA0115259_106763 [Streptomyces sp. MnatMP-M17]
MEQSEVVLRAIGILTQSAEWIRTADRDSATGAEAGAGQIGALLAEVFPSFTVSPEATPLEAAHAVTEAALPAIMQLIGAFSFVYSELAEVHDSGRTDITSEALLRELALRMSRPNDPV